MSEWQVDGRPVVAPAGQVSFLSSPTLYRVPSAVPGNALPSPQGVLAAMNVDCRHYAGIDPTLRAQALLDFAGTPARAQVLDVQILAYCRAHTMTLASPRSVYPGIRYPFALAPAGQVVADAYPNIGVSIVGLAIAFAITYAGAYYGSKAARRSR